VDAAYAPLFMRMALLEEWSPMGLLDDLPKMQAWSERLLARPSVVNSVVEELPQLYRGHISSSGGYGAKRFGE
jgi:glutathione S-transferase